MEEEPARDVADVRVSPAASAITGRPGSRPVISARFVASPERALAAESGVVRARRSIDDRRSLLRLRSS